MKRVTATCATFCISFALHTQADIALGILWTTAKGGNNHLYVLTTTRDTWTASEATAVAVGGYLVSITSAAEENFLVSTLLVSDMAATPLRIDLTDQPNYDSQSYTTWTSGEAVTYGNFFPGEPNNQQSNEDYVAMDWHYSFEASSTQGAWNGLPDGGSTVSYNDTNARALGPHYGIVEIVPEPRSKALLTLCAVVGSCILWHRRPRISESV